MLHFSLTARVAKLFVSLRMATDQNLFLFLLFSCALLSSCGGSGGSAASNTSMSASKSSQTIKTASDYAAPQSFDIKEGEVLSGRLNIKIANPSVFFVDKKTGGMTNKMTTDNGGQVGLSDLGADAGVSFDYTPQAGFYGEDEFTYMVSPKAFGASDIVAAIKVNIRVLLAGDDPRVHLLNRKVFSNRDTIELTHFFRPVSNRVIAPDSTTAVLVDGVALPLEVSAGKILVQLNDFQEANTKELVIRQVIDGQVVQQKIAIRTKVVALDYEIYQGKLQAPGVVVAVVFDNDEPSSVIEAWKADVLAPFVDMTLQKKYSNYFSLILIKKVFPSSFAPNKFQFLGDELHTAIDGVISRHTIAMGVGSRVDGGWASGNTIGIDSRHGINTFIHELGHAQARLGDEYEPVPKGVCGVLYSPNLSYESSADTVPWSHWIVDKNNVPGLNPSLENGMGIFTGSWCERANRPVFNSVMRGGSEMGPVFTEAWALSLYDKLGFLASINPQLLTGKRRLEIKGSVDAQVTDIQWFVDGELQPEWNNKTLVEVDEALLVGSTYTVAAKLVDKTGYILNPNAYLTFNNSVGINSSFYREWAFQQTVEFPTTDSRFQKPAFVPSAAYDCPANSSYCRP